MLTVIRCELDFVSLACYLPVKQHFSILQLVQNKLRFLTFRSNLLRTTLLWNSILAWEGQQQATSSTMSFLVVLSQDNSKNSGKI